MRNLFFLVASLVAMNENRYQLQDFYCYDESGQIEALKVSPKIYFVKINEEFKILSEEEQKIFFQHVGIGSTVVNIANRGENVLLIEYNPNIINSKRVMDFLNYLPDYQIATFKKKIGKALPVFIWRERETIANNAIIVETMPSIADIEVLRKIVLSFGNLEVTGIQEIEGRGNRYKYKISIANLELPANVFVLANLMTENKIYFKWAHPEFIPLNALIWTKSFVTANGLDTLGDKRFLRVEVHITDSKISLRKDLMPQLGEGEFVPKAVGFDDVWFWADKPTITEATHDQERIISFVWPFVYLDTGNFTFKDIVIAYNEEIDGQIVEKNGVLSGPSFQIGSVIAGAWPPITDIQPMYYYRSSSNVEISSNLGKKNSLSRYLSLLVLVIGVTGGGFMIYASTLSLLLRKISDWRKEKILETDNAQYWDELLKRANDLKIENWSSQYLLIEAQMKIVLKEFFNIDCSISSENLPQGVDYRIGLILRALEGVYRDEDNIFTQNISNLKEIIASFVFSFSHRRTNDA